jgi:hypothetical protein
LVERSIESRVKGSSNPNEEEEVAKKKIERERGGEALKRRFLLLHSISTGRAD